VATVVEACGAAGVPAWVIGEVGRDSGRPTSPDVVRGAKGVDGGAVLLTGKYQI
jgi:phosphoribosylformylglycinamidine cyclo-ligase